MKIPRFTFIALSLTGILCLGLPISGQNLAVGFRGQIPIDTLESMDSTLLVADQASKAELLKRLGVDAGIADAASSSHFSHEIEIRPTLQGSGDLYGIMTLPCGVQGQAFLYLLQAARPRKWRVVDSVAMDCFHETPAVGLLSFLPGESSVFVQHANSGHGTGTVEDKAALYIIQNGRFREVLSTFDCSSEGGASANAAQIEQASTFLQMPGGILEETRITSQSNLPLRAERRLWRWDTRRNSFTAGLFREVRE
jgi:hypothetical protein